MYSNVAICNKVVGWLQYACLQAYKNFEIPTELEAVWRYLKNAYMTDAFLESCPADREIITHYTGKMSSPRTPAAKFHLLGEDRTLSIPDMPDNDDN